MYVITKREKTGFMKFFIVNILLSAILYFKICTVHTNKYCIRNNERNTILFNPLLKRYSYWRFSTKGDLLLILPVSVRLNGLYERLYANIFPQRVTENARLRRIIQYNCRFNAFSKGSRGGKWKMGFKNKNAPVLVRKMQFLDSRGNFGQGFRRGRRKMGSKK